MGFFEWLAEVGRTLISWASALIDFMSGKPWWVTALIAFGILAAFIAVIEIIRRLVSFLFSPLHKKGE